MPPGMVVVDTETLVAPYTQMLKKEECFFQSRGRRKACFVPTRGERSVFGHQRKTGERRATVRDSASIGREKGHSTYNIDHSEASAEDQIFW